MDSDLAQQAIQAAVSGDWKTAERLNSTILEQNPNDIDALLRLAHALSQLGKTREAATFCEKVLKIDQYNQFAIRGLSRLKKMKKTKIFSHHGLQTLFVEEPGKTKTVTLVHTASPQVLASLDSGEKVLFVPRRHRISVATEGQTYIGRLPDDLSVRLLGFIEGGNKYEAVIHSVNEMVKIFIREIYRSPKFEQTPSFFHEGSISPDTEGTPQGSEV